LLLLLARPRCDRTTTLACFVHTMWAGWNYNYSSVHEKENSVRDARRDL